MIDHVHECSSQHMPFEIFQNVLAKLPNLANLNFHKLAEPKTQKMRNMAFNYSQVKGTLKF